ncbi:MAG: efflux RND transporter periplasmic adaptor subunit [Candidatus Azotimanducaceae bacterium]
MKERYFPVLIVISGLIIGSLILFTGPSLEPRAPPENKPLIRTITAKSESIRLSSTAFGTVSPRSENELIPEVSGSIVFMSPSLVSGGFFKKDDLLFSIEPLDYEVALEQSSAALKSAESELENAQRNHDRQINLAKKQSISESRKEEAINRLRFAESAHREANARVSLARKNLERTKIRAPYDGRVRNEKIDLGQFVNRGQSIASIYAIDSAEIRLPVHDKELAFLDLSLFETAKSKDDAVILKATFAGEQHTWNARIARTEGELDSRTRMINVIAEIDSPYSSKDSRPPLTIGLFVEAEILGRFIEDAVVIPQSAIQERNLVYTVNGKNRLEFKKVEILRMINDQAVITDGLKTGDTVCISALRNAEPGMEVRTSTKLEEQKT